MNIRITAECASPLMAAQTRGIAENLLSDDDGDSFLVLCSRCLTSPGSPALNHYASALSAVGGAANTAALNPAAPGDAIRHAEEDLRDDITVTLAGERNLGFAPRLFPLHQLLVLFKCVWPVAPLLNLHHILVYTIADRARHACAGVFGHGPAAAGIFGGVYSVPAATHSLSHFIHEAPRADVPYFHYNGWELSHLRTKNYLRDQELWVTRCPTCGHVDMWTWAA